MAQYTVRVELVGKDHDDDVYDELHEAMDGHQFRKWATSGRTKKQYWLPPTEYVGLSDKGAPELAQEVQGWAKNETSHEDEVRVLVTQGNTGWIGLEEKTE